MVTEQELDEHKAAVQSIIDEYLPEDKRFSVKDFTLDGLYYCALVFLEKDPKKREKIYKEIEQKRMEAEHDFLAAERKFLETNNEIMERKSKYDTIFKTINELDMLSNDVNEDQKLKQSLQGF